MRWEDFKWNIGKLRVYSSKTDVWRSIPIDKAFLKRARDRQREQLKEYPNCPWVCHYKCKQIKSVKRAWAESKESAGITDRIRLTDIRHYYITYSLAAGMDVMTLAEIAGHVDAEMIIKVYSHLAKDLRTAKATKLPPLKL